MLSVGTAVEGSAGYVAIDRITGSLHGRRGSFVLQYMQDSSFSVLDRMLARLRSLGFRHRRARNSSNSIVIKIAIEKEHCMVL